MYCTWNGEKYTGHNGKEILVLRNTKKNLMMWRGSQGRRALHQENMSPGDSGVLWGKASSWNVAEKEETLSSQTAYAKYKQIQIPGLCKGSSREQRPFQAVRTAKLVERGNPTGKGQGRRASGCKPRVLGRCSWGLRANFCPNKGAGLYMTP